MAQISDSHDDGISKDDEINNPKNEGQICSQAPNLVQNGAPEAPRRQSQRVSQQRSGEANDLGSLKGVTLGQGFPSLN